MASDKLKLKMEKTEFLIIGSEYNCKVYSLILEIGSLCQRLCSRDIGANQRHESCWRRKTSEESLSPEARGSAKRNCRRQKSSEVSLSLEASTMSYFGSQPDGGS